MIRAVAMIVSLFLFLGSWSVRACAYVRIYPLRQMSICLEVAAILIHFSCLSVNLRVATSADRWVNGLLDGPRNRPKEKCFGWYLLYDSLYKDIRLRPRLGALVAFVACKNAAEYFHYYSFQEPRRKRFYSIRRGDTAALQHIHEGFLDLYLDVCLSAFRVSEINLFLDKALDLGSSDRHHAIGIVAIVAAIVFRRFCMHGRNDLLVQ